ncbi:MAG: YggS family pyridoxal phosphate-dependent enzyme [Firmicutes bacterium]|nr:YggS family pyridoxal phosphate-dependent enzyme [Bacillota bacterium]
MIKENIEKITAEIEAAYARSPYQQGKITMLAVTKTVPAERIKELTELGFCLLGENRVQEMLEKYEALPEASWHIIGHLQTNKVKYIIEKAAMIESVDSIALAEEIEKQAAKHDIIMPVMVQVNIDDDENKFGIDAENCASFLKELSRLPHLRVQGLMTIGCIYDDPLKARSTFRKMKALFDEILTLHIENIEMKYLSMGMSHDYEIAIEEGANIVRIGSAIFGSRS